MSPLKGSVSSSAAPYAFLLGQQIVHSRAGSTGPAESSGNFDIWDIFGDHLAERVFVSLAPAVFGAGSRWPIKRIRGFRWSAYVLS